MIIDARSMQPRQAIGFGFVILFVLALLVALGYHWGHRACAVPVTVEQAHDSTKRVQAVRDSIERPVLAADSAVVQALKAKNAHLAANLDAALEQLARIAVQQKGGFVHTDTDSVHKTGIIHTDSTPVMDPVAAVDTIRAALRRCDTLAVACDRFHVEAGKKFAIDSALVRSLNVEIAAYRARQPSIWHQIGVGAKGGVIGALAAILVSRR